MSCRGSDAACRFGGEEFLLVLANTPGEQALQRAEQIRAQCERLRVPFQREQLSVTLSFGIAVYPWHGDTIDALVQASDRALYAAKRAGRNAVRLAEPAA